MAGTPAGVTVESRCAISTVVWPWRRRRRTSCCEDLRAVWDGALRLHRPIYDRCAMDAPQGHGRVRFSSNAHGNPVAGKGESHASTDAGRGALLGLLVALLTPMAALAQADTTTTHFSDTP